MASFTQTIHASANGISLIEAADYAAMRGLLDLEIGTDVQAYDADLTAIAGLSSADGNIIVGSATGWVAESGATARASLGLTIGEHVQAYDADLTTWAGISPADLLEPTGFINRTSSSLSWDDTTYTLTIAPSGGANFSFYSNGVKYTKTSTTKQIGDTSGLHYIYFNTSGEIQDSTDPWTIASGNVPIATVYWNTAINKGLLADERHGCQMDGKTHEYLHETRGAAYASGLAGTFNTPPDGTAITIGSGEWYDDDIEHTQAEITSALCVWRVGSPAVATWPTGGASGTYYVSTASTVGGIPAYDNAGTLTNVDANKFSNIWIYQTNITATPIIAVIGQAQYNTQALAEAATPASLTLTFLPAAELILLYQITYQRNSDAFLYKSAKDYRKLNVGSATAYTATDHRALTNLTWGSSGHTGTASTAATFDADGLATYVTYGSMILQAANNVNIDGGTIDGTTIGGSTAAAGSFTTVTTSGEIGVMGAGSAGYPIVIHQVADNKGLFIWGFDDQSGKYIELKVDSAGKSLIAANAGLEIGCTGAAAIAGSTSAGLAGPTAVNIDSGGTFTFRDIDDTYATRVTIASATGELAIISDTVGLKLGAGADATIIYDGTNLVINPKLVGSGVVSISGGLSIGGDLNANGNTIHFGTAENVSTPTGTTVTIDLGAENHHTLNCGSATGTIVVTFTAPPGPTAGTIIIIQDTEPKDITWPVNCIWLGTEPTWSSDTSKTRIVSWRYDATNYYLSATDTTA